MCTRVTTLVTHAGCMVDLICTSVYSWGKQMWHRNRHPSHLKHPHPPTHPPTYPSKTSMPTHPIQNLPPQPTSYKLKHSWPFSTAVATASCRCCNWQKKRHAYFCSPHPVMFVLWWNCTACSALPDSQVGDSAAGFLSSNLSNLCWASLFELVDER